MNVEVVFCPDCQRTDTCVCMVDGDDEWEGEPKCELCYSAGEVDECDNCNFLMCATCWGLRCIDDLYVGWCHDCAG